MEREVSIISATCVLRVSRRALIQAVHKLAACVSLLLDRQDIIETPIEYDEPNGQAEFLNERMRPVWLALIVPGCPLRVTAVWIVLPEGVTLDDWYRAKEAMNSENDMPPEMPEKMPQEREDAARSVGAVDPGITVQVVIRIPQRGLGQV